MFFSDPYRFFEPNGKFVMYAKFSVDDGGENYCTGYEFEFINCECPIELEEYLNDNEWLFVDNKDRNHEFVIKDIDMKSKFKEIIDDGGCDIDNNGSGCLRLSDFNFKKEFKRYLDN